MLRPRKWLIRVAGLSHPRRRLAAACSRPMQGHLFRLRSWRCTLRHLISLRAHAFQVREIVSLLHVQLSPRHVGITSSAGVTAARQLLPRILFALRVVLQKDGERLVAPRLHGYRWPDGLRYASAATPQTITAIWTRQRILTTSVPIRSY